MSDSSKTIASTPLLWDAKPQDLPLKKQQEVILGWLASIKGKLSIASLTIENRAEDNRTDVVILLHKALDWLEEANRWTANLKPDVPLIDSKLEQVVSAHEKVIHTYYCGDVAEKIQSVLTHYKHDAAKAMDARKQMTQDTLVYFRSVIMLAESIGNAGTHGEKAARLRGLIELLNSAIGKLRQEETEGLLDNWAYGFGGHSDYPYRSILDEMRQLKRENEQMKQMINATTNSASQVKSIDGSEDRDNLPY